MNNLLKKVCCEMVSASTTAASKNLGIMMNKYRDPNSVANFKQWVTKHLSLQWAIDFDMKKIGAVAEIQLEKQGNDDKVLLDCSNLTIKGVKGEDGRDLSFDYNAKATKFGGQLAITIPPSDQSTLKIRIDYEIGKESSAIQWLNPEQTAGKKFPYFFSQCQAIHARTMVPCQDTPAVKFTYDAKVSVKAPLSVVMSANKRKQLISNEKESGINVFEFEQTQPIPAYLIAIGAGDIKSKDIGPRSAVWCEEGILDAAAWEFHETEQFIATAEKLVGPYVWERYDILLLPPSFPYGGMENPCLTFLTPSLLAGDRSLVDVVAHEIAHSWTGNLMSCQNWENFWLNEGFTMFLERKILADIYGEGWRQLNSHIGLADLRESVAQFKGNGPETALCPDLTDTDPDDVFSSVPYEKGYTLLYVLEDLVGGHDHFMPFFKSIIQKFAGKSINSAEFKEYCLEYFKFSDEVSAKLKSFDWDTWLFGCGMPPLIPKYSTELLVPCQKLSQEWLIPSTGKSQSNIKDLQSQFKSLTPNQQTLFLDQLLQRSSEVSSEMMAELEKVYEFSASKNVEILLKWYLLGIRTKSEKLYAKAAKFATEHGRMKYCRPILRELYLSGESGKDLALRTYADHRSFYHPIAAQMIEKDLKLRC